ncbi:helix-turn-helix domain-containing protein [Paenibacillus sp. LMG 31461]|uniref:Helix-turn-helix domain-containing protein n=1 Tax=Paenibacillus plantarum TaxID=2654975 RepID=A0ABX1XC56_9BACL|nr:AraC family transcriptional regulator [Paenibacillus plantarum]NOU66037.1 helix-turn-helix domain-containing protein [Paenibacillus plantarum]
MSYYRKMFFAFASVSLVFTLLLETIFMSLYWIPSKRQFSQGLDQTARQASEFTDIRLRTPQEMGLMVNLSEYTPKYLSGSLSNYERLKFINFITYMSGITPTLKAEMAVTRFDDDFVIMRNSTGNLDFFRSSFHIPEEMLNRTIEQFKESPNETLQLLHVQDDSGQNMVVLAFCQWVGQLQPLYIFNAYNIQQFFHMKALSEGTLAVYYDNRLVAAEGRLNMEQVNKLLHKGTNYSDMEIHYAASSLPGFRYVYLAEPQHVLTPVLMWMIGAGLAALAASIGITMLITKGMYKPIRSVLQTTGQVTNRDEIAHIRDTIVSLHMDVEEMSQVLVKNKASQEYNTLYNLLIGVIAPEQAEEALAPFPHLKVEGPFSVVVLRYTETDPFTGFSRSITYDAKQRLAHTLQQYLAANPFFRLMDMNYDMQAIIIQGKWSEGMTDGLKNIIIGVEPEYGLDINAFIPPFCEKLLDIPLSYRQGIKMVDASEYLGSSAKVMNWEEADTSLKNTVYYPLHVEQNVINSVIHGKTAIWQSAVNEIIDTNIHERSASLSSLSVMLGGTLNRLMDGSGAAGLDLFQEQANIIDISFRSCRTYEELRQQTLQAFGVLASWFAAEQEKSDSGLAAKMLAYVHEHHMQEITLLDLADYLNLSRNYVSTLFKSSTGRNFKDYISEYRHSKACQLIRENSDMKIKEVAELVGCNTDALSRLFVRYSGMVPNDYRKQVILGEDSDNR